MLTVIGKDMYFRGKRTEIHWKSGFTILTVEGTTYMHITIFMVIFLLVFLPVLGQQTQNWNMMLYNFLLL